MIRFIDLRHCGDDIEGRFAFYDTVVDRFVEDAAGAHTWEKISEFAQSYTPTEALPLQRFVAMAPPWARHAEQGHEPYKIEMIQAEGELPRGHASNKDGSSTCAVPLSPVVLNGLAGRKVAYFLGTQTFGADPTIGAVVGQIVIDFEHEVEGVAW